MKKCVKCKDILPLEDFAKNISKKSGLSPYCKKCCVIKTLECRSRIKTKDPLTGKTIYKRRPSGYKVLSKEYNRDMILKRKYNITLEEYNKKLINQEGKCAICKRHFSILPKALDVDHCHKTDKVRGLLCNKCNRGIGFFQEDQVIILNALNYIKSFQI